MDRAVFTHNTLRDFVSHFCFRVADDNIIVRHQKCVGDLTLCRETFARTGSAEDKPIGIFQLFSVHHNQIVGQGVQAVVQRFFSALVKFLRGERDEDCRAAGGKAALDLDLVICQRQRGHQTLLLLIVQPAEIAVVLLGDAGCLKDVVFQLLLCAPGVQNKECHQKHPFILALQLFEQCLCISSVSCQIGRDDVNIITGTDSFFLVE